MKTVYIGGEGEIVEKKSRFIATVRPVASEEEAVAFIAEMKKKYWDARHNCSAFVIGDRQELSRCSDDGEPAQTAGPDRCLMCCCERRFTTWRSWLHGISAACCSAPAVWCGRIREPCRRGLLSSTIIDKKEGIQLTVGTDYTGLGKLQYLIAQQNLTLIDTVYTEKVELQLMVPAEQQQEVEKEIVEATNGSARISWGEKVLYALVDKKIEIFEKNT